MILEPILGLLASVFGIIVLLEDDALSGPVMKYKAALQVLLQNLDVKVPIHPPINLASISNLHACIHPHMPHMFMDASCLHEPQAQVHTIAPAPMHTLHMCMHGPLPGTPSHPYACVAPCK